MFVSRMASMKRQKGWKEEKKRKKKEAVGSQV